jgi:hypothetical protein
VRGLVVLVVRCQEVPGGRGQQRPDVREYVATGRAQEAGVSDGDEALGQDMLEEASDECWCGSRPVLPRVAPTRFAAEGDVSVCELCHAVVGHGQAAAGGGEGGDALVAGATGAPWVTQACGQTWAGACSSRLAGAICSWHLPRKMCDSARTGTSQSL